MPRPRHQSKLLLLLVFPLLLLLTSSVGAQTNVPLTTDFGTEFKIWTSGGNTFVNVRLTFRDTGHSVSDWGTLTKVGNEFSADAKVYRWTGASGQAITFKENTYILGPLPSGFYSFTFKSHGTTVKSEQFDPTLVVENWEPATLPDEKVGAGAWTYQGVTTARVEFHFPDMSYRVIDWGNMSRVGNEFSLDARIERRSGAPEGWSRIVDRDFQLGSLGAGNYTITVKINGAVAKTRTFTVSTNVTRPPRILTERGSDRAIAIDSVSWMRQLPLDTSHNFSSDRRLRIMLLASDLELPAGASPSDLSAYAEDSSHRLHPMTVEYVGTVPGFDWLTQIVVRPPDELRSGGEIGVVISARGMPSNKVLLNIQPSTPNPQ